MDIMSYAFLRKMSGGNSNNGGGGITPTGTIEITENGTHDVTNYASANVNVASSGGGGDLDALIDGSITEVSSSAESIRNSAFSSCTALTTADFPLATSIGNSAFGSCSKLTTVDFPLATSIGGSAFSSCTALTTADFPLATSIGNSAFGSCTVLTTAYFPSATSIGNNAFGSCSKLTTVDFPLATKIDTYAFSSCTALTTADFPLATSIGGGAFTKCYILTTLILRSETMCTLANSNAFSSCYHILGTVHSTYNPNGDKDGYIYVPRDLVESYKTATNWTTYASQFRALEDYTVDGTITGALDETKI